jgi:hypothetical protein
MHDCPCCGLPVYGKGSDELCTGCYNGCDPAVTWHCYTGYCDGSGCTYPGECEETEIPKGLTSYHL